VSSDKLFHAVEKGILSNDERLFIRCKIKGRKKPDQQFIREQGDSVDSK
jgi:hypothetical protein